MEDDRARRAGRSAEGQSVAKSNRATAVASGWAEDGTETKSLLKILWLN